MSNAELFQHLLRDGLILSALALLFLLLSMRFSPRLWLGDYPKPIQEQVEPKTEAEKRLSLRVGIPFLLLLLGFPLFSTWRLQVFSAAPLPFSSLFLNAFGVAFIFNLVDLLLVDWLMFCTITPAFIVLPGTQGNPAYKDYGFHFRGFLKGTLFSAIIGLLAAGVVWLLV